MPYLLMISKKIKPSFVMKCAAGTFLVTLIAFERHSRNRPVQASKLKLLNNEVGDQMAEISLIHNLREKGVCVLSKALTTEDLKHCLKMKSFRDSAAAKSSRTQLSKAHFWESTGGRFHLNQESFLKYFPEDCCLLRRLEESWQPLVDAYLPAKEGVLPYRSDVQLLISLPQSKDQFFHQDNRRQGLTVTLPLVEVTAENGPTQLLPGSHRITQGCGKDPGYIDCSFLSVIKDGDPALRACVPAGSAVIYDSRTLHRGLANHDPLLSRPILVYRYDYTDTPQPGHSISSTILFRGIGILICAMLELKAYCFTFI